MSDWEEVRRLAQEAEANSAEEEVCDTSSARFEQIERPHNPELEEAQRKIGLLARAAATQCLIGVHKLKGTSIPHTYECVRCGFRTAGHP